MTRQNAERFVLYSFFLYLFFEPHASLTHLMGHRPFPFTGLEFSSTVCE